MTNGEKFEHDYNVTVITFIHDEVVCVRCKDICNVLQFPQQWWNAEYKDKQQYLLWAYISTYKSYVFKYSPLPEMRHIKALETNNQRCPALVDDTKL